MVSGAAGLDGRHVPEHVVLERRNDHELALTHHRHMEEKIAKDPQMKHENVVTEFVQVSDCLLS